MRNDVGLVPEQGKLPPGVGPERHLTKVDVDMQAAARKADEPDGSTYVIPAVGSTDMTSVLYWVIPGGILVVGLMLVLMWLW
jgi:hypothetical protein